MEAEQGPRGEASLIFIMGNNSVLRVGEQRREPDPHLLSFGLCCDSGVQVQLDQAASATEERAF
jgi:hypothetical protein